mmetsp:Transcript_5111/g.14044  ORF Transcript_5111/g.14044 Transcript_5111/m.14044 type:complete len:237 (+) Transcript_5111:491-1201(+)
MLEGVGHVHHVVHGETDGDGKADEGAHVQGHVPQPHYAEEPAVHRGDANADEEHGEHVEEEEERAKHSRSRVGKGAEDELGDHVVPVREDEEVGIDLHVEPRLLLCHLGPSRRHRGKPAIQRVWHVDASSEARGNDAAVISIALPHDVARVGLGHDEAGALGIGAFGVVALEPGAQVLVELLARPRRVGAIGAKVFLDIHVAEVVCEPGPKFVLDDGLKVVQHLHERQSPVLHVLV